MSDETELLIEKIRLFFPAKHREKYVEMLSHIRWANFTDDELENINGHLKGEQYDGKKWYEPHQAMLDEIEDEMIRRAEKTR